MRQSPRVLSAAASESAAEPDRTFPAARNLAVRTRPWTGKMKPYKNRENIYHADRWIRIVAKFGRGDWRLSAAPGSLRYPSRAAAIRAAIAERDPPAPSTGATNGQ